jgi:hypothetical protein
MIEPFHLVRAEDLTNRVVQLTLLLVESIARLVVDLFEALTAVAQNLPDLLLLRGIELQFRDEVIHDVGRKSRRTAAAGAERAASRTTRTAAQEPGKTRPWRRQAATGEKSPSASEAEDRKDEQRKPDTRPVIWHSCS